MYIMYQNTKKCTLVLWLQLYCIFRGQNFKISWPLKMWPIGCSETSVRNYQYELQYIPKEPRSTSLRIYFYYAPSFSIYEMRLLVACGRPHTKTDIYIQIWWWHRCWQCFVIPHELSLLDPNLDEKKTTESTFLVSPLLFLLFQYVTF